MVDDLFQLISIGGVLFYDTGYAWTEGQVAKVSDLKGAVGTGFRFGLTKSSSEVIVRIDFAYRIERTNSTDPHFVVIFGNAQIVIMTSRKI